MEITLEVSALPPRSMMNLHTELGNSVVAGKHVRFCQHINGSCFWMSVDGNLYLLETEHLMNAMLNVVMERELAEGTA